MIVCIAKNYQEFEKWRDHKVVYVGDKFQLAKINPADVREVIFVGDNYRDHPFYFSDELLEFQMNVSLAKRGDGRSVRINELKKPSWFKRLLMSFDGLGRAI